MEVLLCRKWGHVEQMTKVTKGIGQLDKGEKGRVDEGSTEWWLPSSESSRAVAQYNWDSTSGDARRSTGAGQREVPRLRSASPLPLGMAELLLRIKEPLM